MEKKKKIHHPIDHGWAWLVLCGGIIAYMCGTGMNRSFGIFYVEYVENFNATATETSLVAGIMYAFYCVMSLYSLTVGLHYHSSRQLVMVGGFLCSLGFVLSRFAKGIHFLMFSHGVVVGSGQGLIFGPTLYIIGQYFDKKRGLANGILMASCSIGGLIFVPFSRYLLDEYNLKGALLIVAAVLGNILSSAMLLRPTKFFTPRKKKRKTKKKRQTDTKKNSSNGSTNAPLLEKEQQAVDPFRPRSNTADSTFSPLARKAMLTRMRSRTESEGVQPISEVDVINKEIKKAAKQAREESKVWQHEAGFKAKGGVARYMSVESVANISVVEQFYSSENNNNQTNSSKSFFSSVFDCIVFRNVSYVLFLFTYCFGSVGSSLPMIYLPAFAVERQVGNLMAAVLVIVAGVSDVFGRVFYGVLCDKCKISPRIIVFCGLAINCVLHFLTSYYTRLWSLMVYAVIYGVVGGGLYSLHSVILMDVVGSGVFRSALAILSVFQGIAFAISNPLIGALRDATGSYVSGHMYLASCLLAASILIFIDIIVSFLRNNTSKENKDIEMESASDSDSSINHRPAS